jgi:PKHD-type hydroxylase|tara:strand:+ start:98 stop:703 length:606 start_codon:yes stop_codon:yes gene_type:complete
MKEKIRLGSHLINPVDRSKVGILNSVFTSTECKKIIKDCEQIEPNDGTITTKAGYVDNKGYRSSKVRWIPFPQVNPRYKYIYSKIQELVVEINSQLQFEILGLGENIQFGVYEKNDHYDWHMDVGPNQQSIRKFSMSILLNHPSEFEGGDLVFKTGRGEEKKPMSLGDVVFFPSYFLHKVEPITKGIRKSLVVWVSGNPYR